MARQRKAAAKEQEEVRLRGWKEIAQFLGQPQATAQHWAKEGLPVRKEGRFMTASRDELSRWLGRESGEARAVRIATDEKDLSSDLRRALREARRRHHIHRVK